MTEEEFEAIVYIAEEAALLEVSKWSAAALHNDQYNASLILERANRRYDNSIQRARSVLVKDE